MCVPRDACEGGYTGRLACPQRVVVETTVDISNNFFFLFMGFAVGGDSGKVIVIAIRG